MANKILKTAVPIQGDEVNIDVQRGKSIFQDSPILNKTDTFRKRGLKLIFQIK